jgi:cation:H+ antiporter
VNPLAEIIDALGFTHVATYLALFLAASLLMIWRLEALLDHGLEGTALGTLVMPYCSGLGNLIFVALIASRGGSGQEVLTNCLVNNVTNLTLLLGLPALFWGLQFHAPPKPARKRRGKKQTPGSGMEQQLTRLSLSLTVAAVLFFSGVTWALASDGRLQRTDGVVLIALFLFWQCFQVFDVLKHNVRQQHAFGPMFYLDLFVVLLGALGLYSSIEWLVTWIERQPGGFISSSNLGWLSGWLMVLPNALLAFFYAARRRADVAYASQVGDGHICIPLCLGISAAWQPVAVPGFFEVGIGILAGAAFVHLLCILLSDGLPRWMGWPLLGAYVWFVAAGFM